MIESINNLGDIPCDVITIDWIHEAMTINIVAKDFINACVVSLYPKEVEFKYEQL